MTQIRAIIFKKSVKPLNSVALPFRKTNVTEPKATLITSKDQFQQQFANKILFKECH